MRYFNYYLKEKPERSEASGELLERLQVSPDCIDRIAECPARNNKVVAHDGNSHYDQKPSEPWSPYWVYLSE